MAYKSNFTESVIDGSFYAPIKNVKKKQKNKNQSMIQQNNSIDSKSEINISKLNKVTDLYNNTKNNYEETITKLKKIDVPFSGNVYKSLPDNFEDAMKTISEKNKEIKTKTLNSINQITGNKTTLHKSSNGRTHGGNGRILSPEEDKKTAEKTVNSGWINSGAFKDGYQFGDVTRTGLATINDFKQDFTTGALKIGEGTVDAGAWLLGKAGNLLQIDGSEENMQKFIEKDLINEEKISKGINSITPLGQLDTIINQGHTEDNSALSDKTDSLVQSGGQLGGTILLQAGGVPWWLTTGSTSFGTETENAFKQGATYDEAGISGAVSAGGEILTEKLFGGISFGGKTLDEGAKRLIKDKVKNKLASTLLRYGLDVTGEGAEEVISEAISNVGRLSYQDKTLQEALFSEEAFDNYLDAFVGGAILGGGMQSVNAYSSIKSGRDYDSGLTDNEQKVIDKELENRKAEAEKEGKKLSKKDISKIEEEIKNNLIKGDISTKTIESVLGGDEYKQYKTILDKQNRYNELLDKKSGETSNREKLELEALTKELEGVNINTLKSNLDSSMADKIANDDFLKASYNEKAKRSVKYNADLTKYDAKQQEVIKKAIDSGILNDTRKTHEFVDMVAKISADKGVSFDFANNQKLKDSGFAVEGKQVNGFVGKNGITINIDSNNALNKVVGHEITHVLEGTELYTELQKAVKEYATTKGEYDTRLANLTELYKDVEGANVENELISDLVGEYLFSDADFVNNLSATKPNVFKKVYNEIKYLLKVATAGSKEARQLEKVKKVFEDAYRSNVTNVTENTKFSIENIGKFNQKEYNNISELKLPKNEYGRLAHIIDSDTNITSGVNKVTLAYKTYDIYYKGYNDFKVIDAYDTVDYYNEVDSNEFNRNTNINNIGNETTGSRQGYSQFSNGEVENGTTTTGNDGVFDNNKGQNSKQEYSDSKSIGNQKQELDNSSFFNTKYSLSETDLKQKQLDIVLENNPVEDDYHTWIRYIDDIKTFEETLQDPDWSDYVEEGFNPDFTGDMVKEALETGKITVYSSYPIEQGIFVSPSYMEAESYSGDGKVYSKEVNLSDIAWIDPTQGQYAKVNDVNEAPKQDNQGRELTLQQQEYFKDSKVRNEEGNLEVVYHGSKRAGFTTFSTKDGVSFYTNNSNVAKTYSGSNEFVDTKKLNSIEEANQWLEELGLNNVTIEKNNNRYGYEFSDKEYVLLDNGIVVDELGDDLLAGYTNEKDVLKNLKQDIIKHFGNEEAGGNYEGYVNITNPLIVEVDNNLWSQIPVENIPIENAKELLNKQYYREKGKLRTSTNDIIDIALKSGKYDGVIFKNIIDEGIYNSGEKDNNVSNVYATFNSNQFKAIDNTNPTSDADIRYSLSNQNEDIAPVRGDIYGSDIKLQVEEAIAPLKEDIAKLQESLQPITQLDETNLTTEADSNTENNEFRALTEEDLPMFEQQYKEALVENIAPIEREQTTDYMQDTISLDEKSIKALVKSVTSPLDLNRTKKIELENVIQEFSKNGDATKQDLFDTLQDKFGEMNIETTLEDVKQAQETLRKTKVNVDRLMQKDIKDYFYLKQKNFGKIKFSKEGLGVDQVYQELSSEYPSIFPKEIDVASDQLLHMIEVANMDSVEVEKMYFDDEYLQDITDHIYDSVQDYKFKETLKLVEAQNRLPIDESLIPPEIVETPSNTEVVEDIAPINTESDTQVEEKLPIKERNKLKLENYKTLLNSYQEQKVESYESFNKEIYAKTNQYADLTNKNTIKANNLKMQIENLKLRRDNAQIEYDRKIENTNNRIESMSTPEFKEKELAETRKELQQAKIDAIKNKFHEQGYDFDEVLDNAKSKSTLSSVDNTPQRFVEKSLGYKEGQILNDLTSNQTALNESEGIKWLNSFTNRKEGQLAKISKEYNIKPFSKEDKAAQMYGEGFYVNDKKELVKYGDDELAKDFPNLKTQERIKGLAKDPRIRKIYDDTLTSINESRARNGYPEIPRRKDYFLHFRAMEDTFSKLGLPFNPNDIKAKDLPTDMAGMTTDLKPGQPYFASAKKRLGHDTTYSLLGGMEKYLNSAKNQIYHIDDIQTLRALRNYIAEKYGQAKGLENLDLMTPEEAEARIKEVYDAHLSNFAKFLNEQANVLAGKTSLIDRGLEGIIGRRGIQTLDTINSQVGKNMVGFSVASPFTNLISSVQAFAKSNKYDSIKAFAQLSSNKIKSIFGKSDGFVENDPTMIRRQGIDNFYRTPYQKVSDFGYLLMGGIDNISSEFIIRTKYNELTRKGMDSEQAHIEAGKWASRILGDRSLGQQPQLYNSKMLGLFTKFQLEVRNQLDSQFYDTIQEAKVDTETIQNQKLRNAKKAAKITSTMVQLAIFQHLFGKAFESVVGYNPAFDVINVLIKAFGFDDDEESEDTVGDNLEQAFMELLGDLPYTSTLTGGRIPIESALPIEQLITGKDSYGNEKNRWETLSETLPYYVLPGGYNQAKKTYQGLSMFTGDKEVTGSYTDSGNLRFPVEATPQNILQAALFGQYASSNARDYFDNERKPLKEKQIQEYVDLDIPIADYWKYREGLTEQKTIQDKFDYINSLDVTDEQKNIMINNAVTRKEEIDISNYDDFGSYEEFDFATKNEEKYEFLEENNVSYEKYLENKDAYDWAYKNPEKYEVVKQIDSLENYISYKDDIESIKEQYSTDNGYSTEQRKAVVQQYIESLSLDVPQKIMLEKMAGGYSIKDYENYMYGYIESLPMTAEEKQAIHNQLFN